MSCRVDTTPLIASSCVVSVYAGHGVRGDQVPPTGDDGPGYLYGGLSLPADAAKELRGLITRWPSGALDVVEDSSFTYVGSTDYALYQLFVDGVASTTDIGYGAGIGRFDFGVGGPVIGGGIALDDVVAAGAFGAIFSTLSGGVTLGDVAAAGAVTGGAISAISGDVALDGAVADGALVGQALGLSLTPGRIGLRTIRLRNIG